METQLFTIEINNNETKVIRNWNDVDSKLRTNIKKSKNTSSDNYNKRIGIIVGILKTLGYSKRVINKIVNILVDETKYDIWS